MKESLKVLDIGCAKSNHCGIYGKPSYRTIGIDLRTDFVKAMIKINPQSAFLLADGHNLPFADNTFDQIYITNVLEHVDKPEVVLREAYRTLKTWGTLIVDVPHPRYEKVLGLISPEYRTDHFHQHVFEPGDIKNSVEQAGFNITEYSPRMWQAAISICALWLNARLTGQLQFDHDNGELLNSAPAKENALRNLIHTMIWLSENKIASPKRYYLLSLLRFPNRIFPWATYIEAIKPSDKFV